MDAAPFFSDSAFQVRLHRSRQPERRLIVQALFDAADAWQDEHPLDLDSNPHRHLANKLCSCGRHPTLWQRPDGRMVVVQARCRSRVCPTCRQDRILRLRSRVQQLVEKIDDARLLTLTMSSSDEPLREQFDRLKSAFARLRRTKAWKAHVTGGVVVCEATWNHARQQWHPHLHAVIDGCFWEQGAISALWSAVTGGSPVVDIRRVPSRRALVEYVAKYATKCQTPSNVPNCRLVEWASAIHGLRLAQTFGTLHGIPLDVKDDESPGPCEQVAPLDPLVAAADGGDSRASRLWRAVGLCVSRRVPSGDGPEVTRALERHRRIAERVRAWWIGKQELDSGAPDATARTRKKRPGHGDRTLWLWEKPATAPPVGRPESAVP